MKTDPPSRFSSQNSLQHLDYSPSSLYRQAASASYAFIMTINIANLFKSQGAKTFDKRKIGRDVHAGECFANVNINSGKKIFKFGTITTVVDDSLSKLKPLERVVSRTAPTTYWHLTLVLQRVVQSSSLFKKILSKVKSAKDNIAKSFKPTGRWCVSEAVACIDLFAIPSVEHRTPNHHSSTLIPPSILWHVEPKVQAVNAYGFIPPCQTSLLHDGTWRLNIDGGAVMLNCSIHHVLHCARFTGIAQVSCSPKDMTKR